MTAGAYPLWRAKKTKGRLKLISRLRFGTQVRSPHFLHTGLFLTLEKENFPTDVCDGIKLGLTTIRGWEVWPERKRKRKTFEGILMCES